MQDDPHTTPGFKLPDAARADASHDDAAERGAKTMTKAELAEALFDRLGLNKREAKDMVDGFFDEIRQALERGESVKLSGFGNFQLRDKPQRPGRNPEDRRGDRDHGAPRGDLPRQPEAEGGRRPGHWRPLTAARRRSSAHS